MELTEEELATVKEKWPDFAAIFAEGREDGRLATH
jgi:hypothetical protein